MLEKIKILGEIDEWGGRSVCLDFTEGDIEAPTRLINSTVINSLSRLNIIGDFDTPVVELTHRLLQNYPNNLTRKNGTYGDAKENLKKFVGTQRGREIIYRPQLPNNYFFDNRGIKMLIDLQGESGLSIITLPELPDGVSQEQYLTCIKKAIKYANRRAIEIGINDKVTVMPYINAGMANHMDFQTRLDAMMSLVDDHQINAIGVSNSSFDEYRPNYESLGDYEIRAREFWIHGSGVQDFPTRGTPTAKHHVAQKYGIDTVSSRVPYGGSNDGPKKNENGSDVRAMLNHALGYIRFFDRESVEYLKGGDLPENYFHSSSCECLVCRGRPLFPTLAKSALDMEGTIDEQNIRDCARLHNTSQSISEFDISRNLCCHGELKEYFGSKAGLKQYMS